jgi:hypothetical protein
LDVFLSDGAVYDMVLLAGTGVTIEPDLGQSVRVMFIDTNDDIVNVEYSGAGSLQFDFETFTGPAYPVRYNQVVSYVKGHAFVTVAAPNNTSNLKIYSVGRANSLNQALFRNHLVYDGVVDLGRVTLATVGPRSFGTLDLANVRFSGSSGGVGIAASDISFASAVSLHDIHATGTAISILQFGSVNEVRVLGGSLWRADGRPVMISGVAQPTFLTGTNSHGDPLPTRGTFEQGSFGTFAIRNNPPTNLTFSVTRGTLPSWHASFLGLFEHGDRGYFRHTQQHRLLPLRRSD